MKTKFLLVLIISLIFVSEAFAQKRRGPAPSAAVGLTGGINFQNITGTDFWGDKLSYKFVIGFHGGVNIILPVAGDFYLQPGLVFSSSGAREEIIESQSKADEGGITTSIRLSYIEVPLNLLFRPRIGDGYLLAGFGPYVAYGVAGNVKSIVGTTTSSIDVRFKNVIGSDDPRNVAYFRGLDAGANIFAGYELDSGIWVQVNSQLGLIDINPEYESLSTNETSYRNLGITLSVGYRF